MTNTVLNATNGHATRQRLLNAWLQLRAEGIAAPTNVQVIARTMELVRAEEATGGRVFGRKDPHSLRDAIWTYYRDKNGLANAAIDLYLDRHGVLTLDDLQRRIRSRVSELAIEVTGSVQQWSIVSDIVRDLAELLDVRERWSTQPERGGLSGAETKA